jgi:hypothetical protein
MTELTREQLAQALGYDHLAAETIAFVHPKEVENTLRKDVDIIALPADFASHDLFMSLPIRLFAAGYVPMRSMLREGDTVSSLYVRSARLMSPRMAGAPWDFYKISMPAMRGRFANHLWQYLFLHLYGLRSCARIEIADWAGREMLDLDDPYPTAQHSNKLEYGPGDRGDIALWDESSPRINAEFFGYFQNVPHCWQPHRDYVRRLFALRTDWQHAVVQTIRRLEGRTLIAIHIRRGDYLDYDPNLRPIFRIVPIEWYQRKLQELWPHLRDPILHVATDDPSLRPSFADLETVAEHVFAPMMAIPEHIRDFTMLRQSAIMLACNSSFSTMAALLADDRQRCYLPNFDTGRFDKYEPWCEVRFWDRFSTPTTQQASQVDGADREAAEGEAPVRRSTGWDRLLSRLAISRHQR